MSDTPRLVPQYVASGLQNKLGLTAAQVFVSAFDIDAAIGYLGPGPHICVVPGQIATDSHSEDGDQLGHNLLRQMMLELHVYVQFKLDPHGFETQQVVRDTDGILQFFEKIRSVLGFTYLANADGTSPLLNTRAMWWSGESANQMVDEDKGIIKRVFYYACMFGEGQPSGPTLTLADVNLNP